MTTKVKFPKLTSDASKQEEIDYLDNVQAAIDPESYLGSLFTPSFVGWVYDKIRSDFSCDLYRELGNAWEQESEANARATSAVRKLYSAETALAERDITITKAKARIEELTEMYLKAGYEYREEIQTLNNRHNNQVRELVDKNSELRAEIDSCRVEIQALNNEILVLKEPACTNL